MAGRRRHARGDMRARATKNAAMVPSTWLSTKSAMVMSEAWSRIGRNLQATVKSRCMSGHLIDQLRAEVVDAEVLRGPAVEQPVLAHHADGLVHLGLRSEEHTSELQSRRDLVCRLLLEKKKKI